MRQESHMVASGPVLWSLEMSTYSTHGNPAQTWQNTTHCTTVQFLHQYCWGQSWPNAVGPLLTSLAAVCSPVSRLFSDLNEFVLSPENKAVYGMLDKSCHTHSGPLLYVALRKRKMLPHLDNAAVTVELRHPSLFGWNWWNTAKVTLLLKRRVHSIAQNIVLLLQKYLAQKEL